MSATLVRVGTAGWSLPRDAASGSARDSSGLERYASRFTVVEINSSFHRPHRRQTYERWAATTPDGFSFSVKMPKAVTHERRLEGAMPAAHSFLDAAEGLGNKLGCLLVQLPPSLSFEPATFKKFAEPLRARYAGAIALEPRHRTWFEPEANRLLAALRIARVLADPVLNDAAVAPGGWPELVYLRLHGSPRAYWSAYGNPLLQQLAARLALAVKEGLTCWCIFDNTAGGAAVGNALVLQQALRAGTVESDRGDDAG